ncbi:MAG: hypothetical protein WBD88_11455 [Mycobacterium sp.]
MPDLVGALASAAVAKPPWEAAALRRHGVPYVNGWPNCRLVCAAPPVTSVT